jgi:hypothetical protein
VFACRHRGLPVLVICDAGFPVRADAVLVFPPREGYTLHNIEARNRILSNKTISYRLLWNGAVQYVCFLG